MRNYTVYCRCTLGDFGLFSSICLVYSFFLDAFCMLERGTQHSAFGPCAPTKTSWRWHLLLALALREPFSIPLKEKLAVCQNPKDFFVNGYHSAVVFSKGFLDFDVLIRGVLTCFDPRPVCGTRKFSQIGRTKNLVFIVPEAFDHSKRASETCPGTRSRAKMLVSQISFGIPVPKKKKVEQKRLNNVSPMYWQSWSQLTALYLCARRLRVRDLNNLLLGQIESTCKMNEMYHVHRIHGVRGPPRCMIHRCHTHSFSRIFVDT